MDDWPLNIWANRVLTRPLPKPIWPETCWQAYVLRSFLIIAIFCMLELFYSPVHNWLASYAAAPFGVLREIWSWPGKAGVFLIFGGMAALVCSVPVLILCAYLLPVSLIAADFGTWPAVVVLGFQIAWLHPVRWLLPVGRVRGKTNPR